MGWVFAHRDVLHHLPRGTIDDRDAIVRRIRVDAPIGMSHHGMSAAHTQTRRRPIWIKHKERAIAAAFQDNAISAFEHRDILAHGECPRARSNHRVLAAQSQILLSQPRHLLIGPNGEIR
jgi:hypothetical protein